MKMISPSDSLSNLPHPLTTLPALPDSLSISSHGYLLHGTLPHTVLLYSVPPPTQNCKMCQEVWKHLVPESLALPCIHHLQKFLSTSFPRKSTTSLDFHLGRSPHLVNCCTRAIDSFLGAFKSSLIITKGRLCRGSAQRQVNAHRMLRGRPCLGMPYFNILKFINQAKHCLSSHLSHFCS